jgi:hypothetical protein
VRQRKIADHTARTASGHLAVRPGAIGTIRGSIVTAGADALGASVAATAAGCRCGRSMAVKRGTTGNTRTTASVAHQMACRVAAFIRGMNLSAAQTRTATATACQRVFITASRIARIVFIGNPLQGGCGCVSFRPRSVFRLPINSAPALQRSFRRTG